MRILLVILAALAVAGGTGFYVMQGLRTSVPGEVADVRAPKLREVFVPARDLPAGTIIGTEALARMEITDAAITGQMVVADAAGEGFLVGSVARQTLPEGVPIARSATVQPGDRGFLAAVLPKGKRAITIPVSVTAGLNGLALPGDRVDLILTYSVSAKRDEEGKDSAGSKPRDIHASETVARNLRLLALDNRVNAMAEDKNGKPVQPPAPDTATLEVTPQQAQAITLANSLGDLSLALNSVADGGDDSEARAVADSFRTSAARQAPLVNRPLAEAADMTLDSDVTSLLRREVQETVPEQVSRIQIVRGRGRVVLAETLPPVAGVAETTEAAADDATAE